MGISKIKILNKREMEGYAKCGYYRLSEIAIERFKTNLILRRFDDVRK